MGDSCQGTLVLLQSMSTSLGAALLTLYFMMIANESTDNATASGITDAPQNTVVVRNERIPYLRKQNLKLGAWNVRTTNDSDESARPERATAIISKELKSANIDICALSEVRRESTGNVVEKDYTIYWSGGTKKEAGVGFAISNVLSNVTLNITPISDRIMCLRLELTSGEYLKLVSVYGPTMQRPQEEKELFYSQLNSVVNSTKDDHLIFLGDFNARVGSDHELWPGVLGRHGVGRMNSNGLMLLNFCTENEFSVMGSMFQLPNSLKVTWQHLRSKHWHQIDHVIANKSAKHSINVTKVDIHADCFTDHRLLICKCSFSLKKKRKGKKPPRKPFLNMNSDKINQLQDYINNCLVSRPCDWNTLKATLQTATELISEKAKKPSRDWFDDNDMQIHALLENKHLNRNELQKRIRQMKNDWFVEKANQMEKFYLENNIRDFYATLREVYGPKSKSTNQIRSKDGKLLVTENQIKRRWVQHFSELLNLRSDADHTVLNEIQQIPVDNSLAVPITREEIDKALKNTKLRKSPGPDGILPEIVVFGGDALRDYLLEIFNTFWETDNIPAELVNPNICILFKKGDRSECGNYRGISLLSTIGKVIADIVLQRIQTLLPNVYPESQYGYRSGRGTVDGIFTLRQLMEKTREQQCHLYIGFIDFTKAFDTVDRPLLLAILEKIGCPPKLVSLIRMLYTNVEARLIIDGELSNLFYYNSGVKQGCKLAPTFFGIYAAILLWIAFKDIKHEHSVLIRFRTDGKFFDLRRLKAKSKVFLEYLREAQYADDIAIVSNTGPGLQSLLTSYNRTSIRFGLKINVKKTETMCIGPELTFYVDENPLKNVTRFKYLGSFVSADCTLKEEITARIQATSCAYGRLKQRVFNNHDLTASTKLKVYKQCLMPILLYGSETWTLYAYEIRQLRTFQQRHLRTILKIKWDDFISNEEVLRRSSVEDIEISLAKSKLRWLGHVARMDDSRHAKMLLYGERTDGSRPIGRPKLRFKDNIKSLLKIEDLLETWQEIVLDRNRWRSCIVNVCTKLNDKRIQNYERRKQKRR